VTEQISLARDDGSFRAVKLKAIVTAEAGEPLILDFLPLKEDAVIRGIELNKKL